MIQQKLKFQPKLFLVALLDGVVMGTVMSDYVGHRGRDYSVAVSSRVRRQRIGAALMAHVERALGQFGCRRSNLQLLTSKAVTAEIYRRLG